MIYLYYSQCYTVPYYQLLFKCCVLLQSY